MVGFFVLFLGFRIMSYLETSLFISCTSNHWSLGFSTCSILLVYKGLNFGAFPVFRLGLLTAEYISLLRALWISLFLLLCSIYLIPANPEGIVIVDLGFTEVKKLVLVLPRA